VAVNVIMPQLGESVVEGTVSRWLKHEGDAVAEFDPIMEVNTDKVDTEIPAPASGTMLKVYVPEGTTVKAGTLLAVIGAPGEALPDGPDGAARPASQAPRASDEPDVRAPSGVSPAVETTRRVVSSAPSAAAPAAPPRDLGFISPVVARLASEHSVDLQQVAGTGRGGRITKKDVLAYLEQRPAAPQTPKVLGEPEVRTAFGDSPSAEEPPPWERPGEGDLFRPTELQFTDRVPGAAEASAPVAPPAQAAPSAPPPAAGDSTLPVAGLRKLIAEHMLRSERTAPHVTTVFEADLSRVLAHQAAHADPFARDGVRLTLTPYFIVAAVAALKAVPLVNSQWGDEQIVLKREINIGMAVALDDGLIVPVVRRADEKSLLGLAREVNDLAQRARARGLKPDEVQGGTFTITNHGVSGSLFATPIINQPQTGILGVGALQKRVVVIDDAIAIRPMVYLTLTFDHRVLDGAVADRFMGELKSALEGWH
jgi:2-oxoglutarate dehydrogenase E2 component (dihydrolipoamide succinyltransferase)